MEAISPPVESYRRQFDDDQILQLQSRIDTVIDKVVKPLSDNEGLNEFQADTLTRMESLLSSDQTVDLPTRTGKSWLIRNIAEGCARAGLRTAIFTNRTHIVEEHKYKIGTNEVTPSSLFDDDAEPITVDTFGKLRRNFDERQPDKTEGVDIVLIDESHRALGPKTRQTLAKAFPSAVRIGFTATPDFSENRSVVEEYGKKIISRSPIEAIQMGLVSPLRIFVHKTEGVIDSIDPNRSDFTPRELKRLADFMTRNLEITDYVEDLVSAGRQGIVSTIPGESLLHADYLKGLIEKRHKKFPDGAQRQIRAGVVGNGRGSAEVLQDFEDGHLDVILFCDLITEGWTSERASFFINGRPTTSIVNLTQQLGRVLQPKDIEAIAIDFIDVSKGKRQRTLLEVLEMDRAVQGVLTGPNSENGSKCQILHETGI